uniref:Uncharacterized protein n=1 Tax=Arundo donax TaxID=35708 RepID=A0A0A9DH20_ARUDO
METELGRVRRSRGRKVPPMRTPKISLILIPLLDRRNCWLLKWPSSTARLQLRNHGMLGGNHPGILKQMRQAQSRHL